VPVRTKPVFENACKNKGQHIYKCKEGEIILVWQKIYSRYIQPISDRKGQKKSGIEKKGVNKKQENLKNHLLCVIRNDILFKIRFQRMAGVTNNAILYCWIINHNIKKVNWLYLSII